MLSQPWGLSGNWSPAAQAERQMSRRGGGVRSVGRVSKREGDKVVTFQICTVCVRARRHGVPCHGPCQPSTRMDRVDNPTAALSGASPMSFSVSSASWRTGGILGSKDDCTQIVCCSSRAKNLLVHLEFVFAFVYFVVQQNTMIV